MARLTNATSAIAGFLLSAVLTTSCSTAKDEKNVSSETTQTVAETTTIDDKAITPSFDCAKARTEVEKLICIHFDSELERLDREINKRYKIWYSKAENKKNVIENQKRWLKNSWIRLGKCSLKLIPKWNNPDDKTCVKRILKNRINFINEKIENAPVTAPENQIELGMLMNGGEFEFVQHNGAINYKDYSALPFSRTEQNFVCEAVKIGKYEKYNFNENKIEKNLKKNLKTKYCLI